MDYDHLTLIINVLSLNDVRDCTHYHLAVYAKSSSDWSEVGKYCFSNDTDQRVSAGNLMKVSLDSFRGAPSLFSATVQRG